VGDPRGGRAAIGRDAGSREAGSRAIVAAMLSMADGFGATVVAEGLEDREQLGHLASLGCRYGQGFLFARDLSAGEADLLLRAQRMRQRDGAAR